MEGVTDQSVPELRATAVADVSVTGAAVVAVAAAEGLVASVVDPKAAQVATGGNQTVTNQPWDAHLEDPRLQTGYSFVPEMSSEERRSALNLCGPHVTEFMEKCEFISLGCYCAPSYAMQLLNVRKNSYPFDWTRSSLEGILHCMENRFEDFLTYSTYNMVDQHVVFGGTRWGGSFWHHNLEAPMTVEDMTRRIHRFLGTGDVSPKVPRVFVRIVNSTREISQALRLRDSLKQHFPEAQVPRRQDFGLISIQEIYLLLLVELQMERGPIAVRFVAVSLSMGLLVLGGFWMLGIEVLQRRNFDNNQHPTGIHFQSAVPDVQRHWSGATAVKWWAGEGLEGQQVRSVAAWPVLSKCIYQFDGGDPARELFVPRRFWGQQLNTFGGAMMERLLSLTQQQAFVLPIGVDASKPFPVQCFGRYLQAGVVGPGRRWPSQAANSCFIFHVPSLLAGRGTIAALCSAGFGGSALSEQRTAKWLGGDSVMACQVEKLWKQQVKDRL
ncbi:unnamed protein product [Cladocopium goreaui]|uniref:Uncharacterized protein n=1 Tax=Cladocopium goreaui TaxID=2562237 RepID=A0A9P1GCG7_9DINO|nr:unnamed protein product [Cladocopium goreaui]